MLGHRAGSLASTFVACAILAGCSSFAGYERGVVVPYSELVQHKDSLEAFAEAEIRAGSVERAFYVVELIRNREFVAQRQTADRGALPAEYRDLGPYGDLLRKRSKGEFTTADAQQLEALERRMVEAGRSNDEEFWRYLRVLEARLEAYTEAQSLTEVPYTTIYGNDLIVASARDAQLSLAPGEALLEYFFGDSTAYVFVVKGTGIEVRTLPESEQAIANAIETLRTQIIDQPVRTPAGTVNEGWKIPARELRQMLIAPLDAELDGVETLYLVNPGPLVNLPFQVLLAGDRVLLEDYRLVYEPSFSFYKTASSRQRPTAVPKALAVGNGSLAMSMKEAAMVAAVFPEGQMWLVQDNPPANAGPLGQAYVPEVQVAAAQAFLHPAAGFQEFAAEWRIYDEYENFNILHFATHGSLSAVAPLTSALALNGDPDGEDGNLTAAEVRTLDLSHAYLAFLSACQSALTGRTKEREDLASIAGAFIIAGMPTVIGSLWSVNDLSTGAMVLRFYESFLENGPGEALRQAALWVRSGAVFPIHAHPKYWAPFNVYGVDR